MKICKCGCNKEVKEKNKNYIKRHRPKIFCGCGCGELIKNGRYKIGHIPLNLCLCGCGQKCSGKYIKEHYYKIRIGKTYYILNCKNCGKTIERLISKQIFCNKICFNIWQKGKNNNPLTGKKFEDYYGEQKSKDIKQKQSLAKKGITYEQRFGEEKSDIIKQNMKNGRKHLTYEERFGEEKANELKDNIRKSVSKAQKGVKESEKTKKLLSIIQKQKAKERYKNGEYYNKIIYHLAHINNGNPTRLENILEYTYDEKVYPGGLPLVTFHKPESRWEVTKKIYSSWLSKP